MSRLRPWLTVGLAALLALLLVGLVFYEHAARAKGTEVLIPIEGLDPRSLLSGHYVALDMGERIPLGRKCPETARSPSFNLLLPLHKPPSRWVALRQGPEHAHIVGAAPTRAEALRLAPIVVRGDFTCDRLIGLLPLRLRLDIGLDRFHASQAEALDLERKLRTVDGSTRKAFAIVSIGQDGRARLKGVAVDGKRVELNWF